MRDRLIECAAVALITALTLPGAAWWLARLLEALS